LIVLETERLVIRRLTEDDAEFILGLLNQPSFLRYIGDKGVRNTADAVKYLQTGPLASYERVGYGPYLVKLKNTDVPVGMCGLLKRDTLPDADVGFAFLPDYWSRGYAFEAVAAVMTYGREVLGLLRIVAITSLDNHASIRLLEKVGLRFEGLITLPEQGEVKLFGTNSGSEGHKS
jgi:RimJ/RimL family protein N-acetyltransferase